MTEEFLLAVEVDEGHGAAAFAEAEELALGLALEADTAEFGVDLFMLDEPQLIHKKLILSESLLKWAF